jgi:hypothetical protein
LLLAGWLLCLLPAGRADSPDQDRHLRIEGARKVVAAVRESAGQNARGDAATGDALTALYVRSAARAALDLPAEQRAPALLLGLGLALDDSTVLVDNPLTAGICGKIETPEQRRARLRDLGKPTMRDRRDWAQHFFVSAALCELLGPALAESAGLLKEQLDMRQGGSGFSFADLQADLAGIAFAQRLRQGGQTVDQLARAFDVAAALPDPAGLREGLTQEAFRRDYGSTGDPRFLAELKSMRARLQSPEKKP